MKKALQDAILATIWNAQKPGLYSSLHTRPAQMRVSGQALKHTKDFGHRLQLPKHSLKHEQYPHNIQVGKLRNMTANKGDPLP